MSPLDTSSSRVAIVSARWHADIVDRAVDSFQTRLKELGITNVDVYQVPGPSKFRYTSDGSQRPAATTL